MFNLQPLKAKIIFLFFLTGVLLFCFPFQTRADFAPAIFIKDVKINEIKTNQIKGGFNVWNSENYYLSNLNYEIKLFRGTDFNNLELVDVVVKSETFSVAPNVTVAKSFIYQYPKNIISGDYTLRLQTITERGIGLPWQDQVVSLQGQSNFLEMLSGSSKILFNDKEYTPLEGVNISSEENVVVLFEVKNPGEAVTVIPHIKIFNRQINMPLFKEYQDLPITFAKGETKEISLQMPKIGAPESYLAEVKFYKDNEQVSGIKYFRWVVKGEGGKIIYLKADKDYFKAGENINLTVQSIGPADLSDIGQGTLEITVFDKDGNLIAKTSKNVLLDSSLVLSDIAIPISKDLIFPEINVKLAKDGKILDERTINLPMFSAEAQQIEKTQIEQKKINKFLVYLAVVISIIISIIIISIIGFLIFRFKIHPVNQNPKNFN